MSFFYPTLWRPSKDVFLQEGHWSLQSVPREVDSKAISKKSFFGDHKASALQLPLQARPEAAVWQLDSQAGHLPFIKHRSSDLKWQVFRPGGATLPTRASSVACNREAIVTDWCHLVWPASAETWRVVYKLASLHIHPALSPPAPNGSEGWD